MSGLSTTGLAYRFSITDVPSIDFHVVDFRGKEELCEPYRFELTLACPASMEDLPGGGEALLGAKAVLSIDPACVYGDANEVGGLGSGAGTEACYTHGVLESVEFLHRIRSPMRGPLAGVEGLYLYCAVLAAPIARLEMDRQNQVYTAMSVPAILRQELIDAGLHEGPDQDFEFLLSSSYPMVEARGDGTHRSTDTDYSYPPWEMLCQYNESSLAFLHRLMEREGIYYYFLHASDGVRMVVTNNSRLRPSVSPAESDAGLAVRFQADAPDHGGPAVRSVSMRRESAPGTIRLRDYNYRKPNLVIETEATAAPGHGERYLYGEHVCSREESQHLVQIRAEESRCWAHVFRGEGNIPAFRPGRWFRLSNPVVADLGEYGEGEHLLVRVEHEGSQRSLLLPETSSSSDQSKGPAYRCRFLALPAAFSFRPRQRTPKPRIRGVLVGRTDLANLESEGQYRVRMPFDLANREKGKGSSPVRFVTPWSGKTYAFHMPIEDDQEVLVAFENSDPDRPMIIGCMMNPESGSESPDMGTHVERLSTGTTTTRVYETPQLDDDGSLVLPEVLRTGREADKQRCTRIFGANQNALRARSGNNGGNGGGSDSGPVSPDDVDVGVTTTHTKYSSSITPGVLDKKATDTAKVYGQDATFVHEKEHIEDIRKAFKKQVYDDGGESPLAQELVLDGSALHEYHGSLRVIAEGARWGEHLDARDIHREWHGACETNWFGDSKLEHIGDHVVRGNTVDDAGAITAQGTTGDWLVQNRGDTKLTVNGNHTISCREYVLEVDGWDHEWKEGDGKTAHADSYKECSGFTLGIHAGALGTLHWRGDDRTWNGGACFGLVAPFELNVTAGTEFQLVLGMNFELQDIEAKFIPLKWSCHAGEDKPRGLTNSRGLVSINADAVSNKVPNGKFRFSLVALAVALVFLAAAAGLVVGIIAEFEDDPFYESD